MIPWSLIIKVVIGFVLLGVLVIGARSGCTVVGNIFTKYENGIKREIADKQNLAYQTAKAEEMEKTLELTKQHHAALEGIYEQQDEERSEANRVFQEEMKKDISGKLAELEKDLDDKTMRINRATDRVFQLEERLSDWSTVRP